MTSLTDGTHPKLPLQSDMEQYDDTNMWVLHRYQQSERQLSCFVYFFMLTGRRFPLHHRMLIEYDVRRALDMGGDENCLGGDENCF